MSWYRWRGDALELRVRVIPRASKTELVGAQGNCYKVRLAAPPLEGKANRCLVDFLSKAFGVGRSQVEILSGDHSRIKTVLIQEPTRSPLSIESRQSPSRAPSGTV